MGFPKLTGPCRSECSPSKMQMLSSNGTNGCIVWGGLTASAYVTLITAVRLDTLTFDILNTRQDTVWIRLEGLGTWATATQTATSRGLANRNFKLLVAAVFEPRQTPPSAYLGT